MSTLAFGQMAYFLFLSLKPYGGQDGIALWTRSVRRGLVDLEGQTAFYLLCLACLTALPPPRPPAPSRPLRPRAPRRARRRAPRRSPGLPHLRATGSLAYTLSAAVTGLAGALLADAIYFVGPSFLGWQTSGELIVMAVLGGLGSIVGPVIGAAAFILLEDARARSSSTGSARAWASTGSSSWALSSWRWRWAPAGPLGLAGRPRCPRMSVLRLEACPKVVRRPRRRGRRRPRSRPRRGPRPDRPERRRQDHPRQPDLGRARPRCRPAPLGDHRRHQAERRGSRPPGTRPRLPDRRACSRA